MKGKAMQKERGILYTGGNGREEYKRKNKEERGIIEENRKGKVEQ